MNIRFYGKSLDGGNQRIPQFMDQIHNYQLNNKHRSNRAVHASKSTNKLNNSAIQIDVSINDRYDIRSNKFKTNKEIDVVQNRMQLIQYQENKRKNEIASLNKQMKRQNQHQKEKAQNQIIKEQKQLENQEQLKEKQYKNLELRMNRMKTKKEVREQLQKQKKQDMIQIKKESEQNQQRIQIDKQQHFLNQQSRRRIIQDNIIKSQQKIDQFWIEKAIHQRQEQLKDVASDDIMVKENTKKLMELNLQEQEMLERLKNTEQTLQMQQLRKKNNNI